MSVKLLFYIAGGGAIGAVGRYTVTVAITQWSGSEFPYGTMLANILGSFLLGCLLAGLAYNGSMSQEMRAFLQVGLLGAFTTFSTFSMDAYQQISRGDYMSAGLYIGTTVIVGIFALVAGVALVRQMFT